MHKIGIALSELVVCAGGGGKGLFTNNHSMGSRFRRKNLQDTEMDKTRAYYGNAMRGL